MSKHFHVAHESLLFGFVLIVADHEILVFFTRSVVMRGCVGHVPITVLLGTKRSSSVQPSIGL